MTDSLPPISPPDLALPNTKPPTATATAAVAVAHDHALGAVAHCATAPTAPVTFPSTPPSTATSSSSSHSPASASASSPSPPSRPEHQLDSPSHLTAPTLTSQQLDAASQPVPQSASAPLTLASSSRRPRRNSRPRQPPTALTPGVDTIGPAPRPPPARPPLCEDADAITLAAVPNIAFSLDRLDPKDPVLELLHRVLFATPGIAARRRAHIRTFPGFAFRDERDRIRVRDKLARAHLNLVRRIAAILDVPIVASSNSDKNNINETTAAPVTSSMHVTTIHNPASASSPVQRPAQKELLHEIFGADVSDHDLVNIQSAPSKEGQPAQTQPTVPAELRPQARRDDTTRASKEDATRAILAFLERPTILPGRPDLAARQKAQKAQRRAAEKARIARAALKRKADEERRRVGKEAARKAEELDGDEDLIDALPWIELARLRQRPGTPTLLETNISPTSASGFTSGPAPISIVPNVNTLAASSASPWTSASAKSKRSKSSLSSASTKSQAKAKPTKHTEKQKRTQNQRRDDTSTKTASKRKASNSNGLAAKRRHA